LERAGELLVLRLPRLPDGVDPGEDQEPSAQIPPPVAEAARQRLADEEAEHRHQSLEEAEGDADPQPGAGIDPREADADRAREVAEADRDAHQKQPEQVGVQPASASRVASKPAPPNGP